MNIQVKQLDERTYTLKIEGMRGFCRPTLDFHNGYPATMTHSVLELRLFVREDPALHAGIWDRFNVPVWAMEGTGDDAGFLFVRTVSPRTARIFTDVIEGGTLAIPGLEHAHDVGQFYNEID